MSRRPVLCLVACLWAISHMSAKPEPGDECKYADCIFHDIHPRGTFIEVYIASFNFSRLPTMTTKDCINLSDLNDHCEAKRTNCPDTVQLPYEQRFHDYIYVDFLMQVGLFGCDHLFEFELLKLCFNDDLVSTLQNCFEGRFTYSRQCVSREFLRHNDCPGNSVDAFLALIERFLHHNPYWNHTIP